jgi:hypothetical protein
MPSGLGHSPVERRPPAVFCCSSWASHKDLIYIIFAFKPEEEEEEEEETSSLYVTSCIQTLHKVKP